MAEAETAGLEPLAVEETFAGRVHVEWNPRTALHVKAPRACPDCCPKAC